jgi:hypothetical protein
MTLLTNCVIRWNSWNHFYCGINEKIIKETGTHLTCSSIYQ